MSRGDQRASRAEHGHAGELPAGTSQPTDLIWPLATAAAATTAAAVLSCQLFGCIPHVQDSIAQLFQARIFAAGRLWAPAPPLPELFDYANVILKDGRWYSQYPPGHALLLLPGVLLGVPWLVNPILGGLAIVATYFLARELGGRRLARLAAILALVSPFLLLMSAEFMNHATTLLAVTGCLLFFFRSLRTGRLRDGVLAGSCAALAILTRPYSAFGILLPCIFYGAYRLSRAPRQLLRPVLGIVVAGTAGVLLLLLYNWGTTGQPLRFGYAELWGPGYGLGFGKGLPGEEHTLDRGLLFTWDSLRRLNGRLFEWPLTSLWPLAAALVLAIPECPRRRCWLLASFPATLLGVYLFYWYHDANDCFGPRYAYEALGPLVIVSAAGILAVTDRIASCLSAKPKLGSPSASRAPAARVSVRLALATVAILSLLGALTRWPQLIAAPKTASEESPDVRRSRERFERFGRQYWGVSPDLGEAVSEQITGRALIFVDTQVPPLADAYRRLAARHLQFGSAFAHQEPMLARARIVYAHAIPAGWQPRGEDPASEIIGIMRTTASYFPGRTVYAWRSGFAAPRRLNFDVRHAAGD